MSASNCHYAGLPNIAVINKGASLLGCISIPVKVSRVPLDSRVLLLVSATVGQKSRKLLAVGIGERL